MLNLRIRFISIPDWRVATAILNIIDISRKFNPLSASKSIDWFLYEGNTGT